VYACDPPQRSDSSTSLTVFNELHRKFHSSPASNSDCWKGKVIRFHNNIHSNNRLRWLAVKRLSNRLTFSKFQEIVTAPRNMASAPSVGSKVIRDSASNGSVWSEMGSSDPRSDYQIGGLEA